MTPLADIPHDPARYAFEQSANDEPLANTAPHLARQLYVANASSKGEDRAGAFLAFDSLTDASYRTWERRAERVLASRAVIDTVSDAGAWADALRWALPFFISGAK